MPAPKTPAKKKEEPTEEQKIGSLIEAVDPGTSTRVQRVAGLVNTELEAYQRDFIQRKLSFMPKLEFLKVVGTAFKQARASGLNVGSYIDGFRTDGADVDFIMGVLGELSEVVPTITQDIYCIALGVPRGDRELVKEIWQQPYDPETKTGGLSDEDGMAILFYFIEQNAVTIRDFYREELTKTGQRLREIFSPQQEQ